MQERFDSQSVGRVLVVGGGQAGAQTCQSLRQNGFSGEILLIGEEPVLPYQRPPLSKGYLKGEMPEERLLLRPKAWYESQGIEVRLGERATALHTDAKTIHTGAGQERYDALVLALGSRPRPCPVAGADLEGVHDLRTLRDIDALRPKMKEGRRLVVIGAGYIGLEAAAVARQLGLEVTVLERETRPLARVAGREISRFYENAHKRRGVDMRPSAQVSALLGEGEVRAVRLETGEELPADIVLVGIGILPNQELAEEAGVACRNGIVVDEDAQTSDPFVFAVGDCARRPLSPYGTDGRLESVHNAIEQGKLAAAKICGRPRPRLDCPWFWSDQYELKLQIAGLSSGHDETVVRGDPDTESFAVYYLREGRLLAVDAVNSPLDFLASKKLVMQGVRPETERLRDRTNDIKELAAEWLAAQGA